jgi:hypothetical protein
MGEISKSPRRFVDALRAALQPRDQFLQHNVKFRAV